MEFQVFFFGALSGMTQVDILPSTYPKFNITLRDPYKIDWVHDG